MGTLSLIEWKYTHSDMHAHTHCDEMLQTELCMKDQIHECALHVNMYLLTLFIWYSVLTIHYLVTKSFLKMSISATITQAKDC